MVLTSFQGKPVLNLQEFERAVDECQDAMYKFALGTGKGTGGEKLVVLDAGLCRQSEPEIFAQHMIAHRSSQHQHNTTLTPADGR